MTQALDALTAAGLVIIALNVGLCLVRLALGPSLWDRILSLECITYNVSGAIVLMSMRVGTETFMVALLVIALLGFLGTVTLTAYLERTLGS